MQSLSLLLEVNEQRVRQVDVVQDALALVEGNVQAVKKVLSVGIRELRRISEAGAIGLSVGVVLHSLNNVSQALLSEFLLGENHVQVVKWLSNDSKTALVDVACVHWVPHNSLIVRNGPSGRGHHSQLMVAVWVDRSQQGVLAGERPEATEHELIRFKV